MDSLAGLTALIVAACIGPKHRRSTGSVWVKLVPGRWSLVDGINKDVMFVRGQVVQFQFCSLRNICDVYCTSMTGRFLPPILCVDGPRSVVFAEAPRLRTYLANRQSDPDD